MVGRARTCTPADPHVEPTPTGWASDSVRGRRFAASHGSEDAHGAYKRPNPDSGSGKLGHSIGLVRVVADQFLIEQHLSSPHGLGKLADSPHTGAAGGAACGDLVRIS